MGSKTPVNRREDISTTEKLQQSSIVTTRNSAKKKLISKMVITRKRLSQENLTLISPVHKPQGFKSRIPVRHQEKATPSSNSSTTTVSKQAPPRAQKQRPQRMNLSLGSSRLPRKHPSKLTSSTAM